MPDYSTWEKGDLKTEVLLLDALNPRIPQSEKKLSQKDLIEILVQYDDACDLAKNIVHNGYIPIESLIGVRENGNIVVVEGNRRLVACKLLINPDLAPVEFRSRFRSLSERIDKSTINKLEVQIAPTREAAMPYIAAKHTRSIVKPWEPLMKANFYLRQLKQGMTVEQISNDLGVVTPSEIKKAVLSATMYYEAIRLRAGGALRQKLDDPRQFNISSFGRILETPDGKRYFGITQDINGRIQFKLKTRMFTRRLVKVITDILNHKIDTRTLNTTTQISEYLYGPKKKKVVKARTVRQTRVTVQFIPTNIICRVASPRIRDVFNELRLIDAGDFPNAHAMTLRLLLELGTYNYMVIKGYLPVLQSESMAQHNNHLPRTFPELFEMLVWLANNDRSLDNHTQRFLLLLATRSNPDPVLDDLNQFVHNISWNPDPRTIATIWKNFAHYLEIILG
jgi:hypothetical protein